MATTESNTAWLPASPADVPTPPFYHIPGIANLRDVGGYAIHTDQAVVTGSGSDDGTSRGTRRSVRRGMLYRSADPTMVTWMGQDRLASELGVYTVFDLRSQPEIEKEGKEWEGQAVGRHPFVDVGTEALLDPPTQTIDAGTGGNSGVCAGDAAVIRRVWTPVFAKQDYSPEKTALRFKGYAEKGSEGFVRAYADILAHAGPAYATVLRWLARGEGGTLVHCTAGKDRTGMLVAVLLLLLGVEERVVAREYALTDQGLGLLKPVYRMALLKHPAFDGNEEGVDNMISTREEAMLGAVAMMRDTYGGVEGYVRDVIGLSVEEMEALRMRLISDEEPSMG